MRLSWVIRCGGSPHAWVGLGGGRWWWRWVRLWLRLCLGGWKRGTVGAVNEYDKKSLGNDEEDG